MTHPSSLRLRAGIVGVVVVAATMLLMLALPAAASAASRTACLNRTNTTYQALLECVTLEGVRAHQAAFQAIADRNDGTRAAGTDGYSESVEYVSGLLEDAGYNVTFDEFQFIFQPSDGAPTARACECDV